MKWFWLIFAKLFQFFFFWFISILSVVEIEERIKDINENERKIRTIFATFLFWCIFSARRSSNAFPVFPHAGVWDSPSDVWGSPRGCPSCLIQLWYAVTQIRARWYREGSQFKETMWLSQHSCFKITLNYLDY